MVQKLTCLQKTPIIYLFIHKENKFMQDPFHFIISIFKFSVKWIKRDKIILLS